MLVELSIRNVVLIDRLDISFEDGLTVLTGETGAGKSILLDALSLAMGGRGDVGLIRHGKDQAVVTAFFEITKFDAIRTFLEELEIELPEMEQEGLVLRRVLKKEGSSRAFLNDRPISVSTLRGIGDLLIEIQGQFEAHGLMRTANHRRFLDLFSGHSTLVQKVENEFLNWQNCKKSFEEAQSEYRENTEQQEFLEFSVNELAILAIKDGEEEELIELRNFLTNAEKNIETINSTIEYLSGDTGAAIMLSKARRSLEKMPNKFPAVVEAIDRAIVELNESENELARLVNEIASDEKRLEEVETRLADIRSLSRKHDVPSNQLPNLLEKMRGKLEEVKAGDDRLKALEKKTHISKQNYYEVAATLKESRQKKSQLLQKAVTSELPEMKMDKASFVIRHEEMEEKNWNSCGIDEIQFLISANQGVAAGPLSKIASGGERSRLLLALRAALAGSDPIPTLIFDEVDSGVGGAVSAAVGNRLKKLGENHQVLVVTHSPQVAAIGEHHWQISKRGEDRPITIATHLKKEARVEEIGRMLSGKKITAEARSAALKLMEG